METILPPAVTPTAASAAPVALAPLLVVPSATPSAAPPVTLTPGQIVEAHVTPGPVPGTVSVTLDQPGQTSAPVVLAAKGAALDLLSGATTAALQVVPNAGGTASLRLLAVDGLVVARPLSLPNTALQTAALPLAAATDALVQTVSAAAVRADAPLGFIATVVKAAPTAAATVPQAAADPATNAAPALPRTGGLAADLAVGTTVTLRIREVLAPSAAVSSPPAPVDSAAVKTASDEPDPEVVEAPAAGQTPDTAPTSNPSMGVPTGIAPKNVVPSGAPALSSEPTADEPAAAGTDGGPAPSAPLPMLLEGKVLAVIQGQRTIVETPVGLLSMPSSAALKDQASVLFDVVSRPRPPAPPPPLDTASLPGSLGRQMAQTLTQAMTTLTEAGEMAALQKLQAILPQLDARMAATMALFLRAVDKGTARALIDGDVTATLAKIGRKDMAERLTATLQGLEKDATEPLVEGRQWRAFTMPMVTEAAIDPVRLYVRQPIDPDGGASGQGGREAGQEQRFVVDLDLSRLGRMQMDGLVQRVDKRFDLIIRAEHPLGPEMRRDITDLFITTLEAVGVKGGVSFQGGGRFLAFARAKQGLAPTGLDV